MSSLVGILSYLAEKLFNLNFDFIPTKIGEKANYLYELETKHIIVGDVAN